MDLVLFVELVETEIQSHLTLDQDPRLKLLIMLTSMKINYLLLHIPNHWFFVFFVLHVMKRNLNIQRRQLRHSNDPLAIPVNTFKGLCRISRDLVHGVFHQILPYMRESERTTAIPKNLRRCQLRDSRDPLTIPENNFKDLFRISRELAHWVFHQLLPCMREYERTTASPKNVFISSFVLKLVFYCIVFFK
ncbi:hypothetical protein FQA39_LY03357 [Lamprigera yunnana]|nr:hypothetical protein FQA39_LY03357 [Lamprigera yunnana]